MRKTTVKLLTNGTLKVPKLLLALCMFLILGTSLKAMSGTQGQTVSLNVKNTKLEQVFKILEKQSSFEFIYNLNDLKNQGTISVKFVKERLDIVINSVLKNTNLCFEEDNNIIIIKKKATPDNNENRVIKGKVTDEKGTPLPGVSVIIKGTNTGVSTDINGEFSIKVPTNKNVLSFSFIGMENEDINVKNKNNINVKMTTSTQQLAEVVVNTGYQRIDKRKLASAVTTVKGKDLEEGAAVSIDNMLQGKIAGLNVINPSGTVGAAPKIRIRGASSISGNREPVWVVDGVILEEPVPISPEELNSLDNVNLIGNAISSVNPEDIEQIDVLKDASATAIYGVKAANGVIVITTKKGKVGKTRVKYSTNFTIDERPQYDDLNRMNSKERIAVSKEIEERGLEFGSEPTHVAYEGLLYELYGGNITYEEFLHAVQRAETVNTDWYDILFRTALSHKHTLTVSGADSKTNYYFSGSFNNANGTFKDNALRQYNALLKINTRINEKVNLNLQLRGYTNEKDYQHSSIDPYSYAYNTSRAIPAYNEDGSLAYYNRSQGYQTLLKYNIINELEQTGRKIENQSFAFNGNVNWKINSYLKFNGLLAYTRSNTIQENWFSEKSYFAANKRGLNYGDPLYDNDVFKNEKCLLPYGGGLSNNNTKNTSYTFRGTLSFKKSFNEIHEISSVVGGELRSSKYEGISTRQYGYMPDRGNKFTYIDPSIWGAYKRMVADYPNVVTDRLTNVVSAFGTFTYAFDRRYIANFNVRIDGSNRFGQDKSNRFLPVWSVSGRWNIHNESFLKNTMWINQLALRSSYGVQGNVSLEDSPFLVAKLGTMNPYSMEYESKYTKLPNPDLTWEKTTSYNVALDFSILDGRINGSVDLYRKKGTDQIVSKAVSATTGMRTMSLNAGDVENKGFDLAININPIRTKNFSWMLSINGGKNSNKVTKSGITTQYSYKDYISGRVITPGTPLSGFYSYQYNGLNDKGLPTFNEIEPEEGETQEQFYKRLLVYSGKRIADITGGFSSSFRYKAFSLSLLFSYSIGKDVRLNDLYKDSGQTLPQPQQNMSKEFVKRWRQEGDEDHTDIPVLTTDKLILNPVIFGSTQNNQSLKIGKNRWQMYNDSDLRVASGDFLRLRNLQFRYAVPKSFCKKIGIASANLKFEGTNLWILKDNKLKGQDPEQVSFSFSTGSGAIPPTSTYTFGFDVTF